MVTHDLVCFKNYIRDSAGTQREKIVTSAKNTPPLPIFAKKKKNALGGLHVTIYGKENKV